MATIAEAMDDPQLLGHAFVGPSWNGWRAILKAAYALPMTPEEVDLFRSVAERDPPESQVRELVVIAGRRAGKDSIASGIAAHAAAFRDYRPLLRRGERAIVGCIASDKDQAGIVRNYTGPFFADGILKSLVERETADGLDLSTGASIKVMTNNNRATRGYPYAVAIFDEVAFWRDENSTTPDKETYRAVIPGLATIPGALLVMISSPYRKSGLLWEKYRKHYGKDGDVLVIVAPSKVLNPTLDQRLIDEALRDDPEAARSEWLGQFRDDIAQFVDPEVVEAAAITGRHELPRVAGAVYVGFTDAAGGSGGDSHTSAVAHFDRKTDRIVLDALRERRPPFSPEATIEEHAAFFKSYGIRKIVGDRWGGEFPREAFRKHGIEYTVSERVKSDIYKDTLPLMNSGRVDLLDNPRLTAQLCALERRTARGGRESIDHPPGGHDDLANAALGAVSIVKSVGGLEISDAVLARSAQRARPGQPSVVSTAPQRAFF
jgi:hypothetical protein